MFARTHFTLQKFALLAVFVVLISGLAAAHDSWMALGPDGGDVRSLAYDPHNPDRIFLGTSSAELFLSTDSGRTWARFGRVGDRDDYVLDHIAIDPRNSKVMFIAAWSVESQSAGDVFRSNDGGKTWQTLPGMHNKSVRAMAMSRSNPDILVAGALDGVFRSRDAGDNWERISQAGEQIKQIESIAIDPKDPNTVYAGTWHLAWKTGDGGANWHRINKGMIDDSDVFSIIVDPSDPSVVFASACSGIYKSEAAGELFHKIQGIPFTARRTRVLHHDPSNPNIVYAGTTEGLWKTTDQGKNWKRVSSPDVVVNDVFVDPRNSNRVLLATDRSGVLASEDGAATWLTSNKGFAHRSVQALIVDRSNPDIVYTGLANDREFGGVFVSRDGGQTWQQRSAGLGGRDVFALRQAADGTLVAGTHKGIFVADRGASEWHSANSVVKETTTTKTVLRKGKKVPVESKSISRSELASRVKGVDVSGSRWYAATSEGLFSSSDHGKTWTGGAIRGNSYFAAVHAQGDLVVAAGTNNTFVSTDGGKTWKESATNRYVTKIYGLSATPDGQIFLASREGAFRSVDQGNSWNHIANGLPGTEVASVQYDEHRQHLFATSRISSVIFESVDGGVSWHRRADMGYPVTAIGFGHGRILGATLYSGVVGKSDGQGSSAASVGGPAGSSSNNE